MNLIYRALLALLLGLATVVIAPAQSLEARGQTLNLPLGDHVDMEFRFDNFFEVLSGMGTIVWDPAVVDFGGVTYTADISGLSASSFYYEGTSGQLAFSWASTDILGATEPDNTVIFTLRFNARENATLGATTQIAFSNAYTPLRFTSTTQNPYPFSSTPGEITIVPEPAIPYLLLVGLLILVAGSRLTHRTFRAGS